MRQIVDFAVSTTATSGMLPSMPAATPTDDVRLLATACNRFGFDLLQRMAPDAAAALSPASITTALLLLEPGARGRTRDELHAVLRLPQELREGRLHAAAGALCALLRTEAADSGESTMRPQLRLDNDLWAQRGCPLLPDYVATLRMEFQAGVHAVDFARDPMAARQQINEHIAAATNQRIRHLLPPTFVSRDTRLILTNTVWFLGTWLHPFLVEATRDDGFRLADGRMVTVPTMHDSQPRLFAESAEWQCVVLPFADCHLHMELIVPRGQGTLADAERALLGGDGPPHFTGHQVELCLPRCKVSRRTGLRRPLQQLGLVSAFDPQQVDLGGLRHERDLVVADVAHEAWLQFDEHGAEAAAASGVGLMLLSAPPTEKRRVAFDRPFAFVLRDVRTGLVLFSGRVLDPRGGDPA